ncbi:MAG: hypothetical protein ACRBB0_10220 [Pelagimonas sp.]|uniref:hypothetical protein n=1 Tax=Pelagimonas sp. TaxID=2073170 RepID=UPI003D6AA27F
MTQYLSAAIAILVLFCTSPAVADDIKLDWNSIELGFFEKTNNEGATLHGIVVYVPGSRIASEDDFLTIVPDFCSSRLKDLLEFSMQIEDAPEVSF